MKIYSVKSTEMACNHSQSKLMEWIFIYYNLSCEFLSIRFLDDGNFNLIECPYSIINNKLLTPWEMKEIAHLG